MQHYLGVAKDLGISEEEIGAVQAVVMAVSAGKVGAQLHEVQAGTKATVDVTARPAPLSRTNKKSTKEL
jgi:hypothetical protein